MALVRLEQDCTGLEASQFVADLSARLVKAMDLSAVLDGVQATTDLDVSDLRKILVDSLAEFSQREDEEILGWVIDYLTDEGR